MLNEVRELQEKAVVELLTLVRKRDEVTFKAPTGSGKTYMMADFMDRVLAEDETVVFIVSSLSKAELAKQNYEAFERYIDEGKFGHLNPYLISSEESTEGSLYIPTDYNVYVLPRDLYKEKSKLKGDAALIRFINEVKPPTYDWNTQKKIYLIKDECHQATSNLDELRQSHFSKVINFSATPNAKKGQRADVVLRETDAVRTHLIKKVEYGDDTDTLEDALEKFVEVRREYHDRNIGVSPCMIIQISNKEKADEEVKRIKATLNKEGFSSLKWMLILDNSEKKSETNDILGIKKQPLSKWKYFAKHDQSTIDIIIFKMVITEGWDIRRACMLYQVRDTKSKILDEQVIGRVRRNPRLLDFETLNGKAQELVSTAWVWGLHEKAEDNKFVIQTTLFGEEVDNEIQNEIRIQTTRLKPFDTEKAVDIDAMDLKGSNELAPKSIFDLYREVSASNEEVRMHYNKWVDDYQKFFKFANNIKEIKKAINDVCCDYKSYMSCTTNDAGMVCEVSFPYRSSYMATEYDKDIDSWVWRQKKDDEFSFDSQAEREWVKVLLKLKKKGLVKTVNVGDEEVALIGKNFLENSEIKYEYYDRGRRFSYPDFVMKDAKDRIHIFEVKSLNVSNTQSIDNEEYEDKVRTLKEFFREVSRVTEHNYYLPIKSDDDWHIWMMREGEESEMSVDDFERCLV